MRYYHGIFDIVEINMFLMDIQNYFNLIADSETLLKPTSSVITIKLHSIHTSIFYVKGKNNSSTNESYRVRGLLKK